MAPSSSRSSTPLVVGIVVIALIAYGVYWMLDDTSPEPGNGGTATISAPDQEPVTGTELPDAPAEQLRPVDAQTPAPLEVADAAQIPDADEYLWEDPLIITGTVHDATQEPVADIEVNLFDDLGDYYDSVSTNDEGEFQFFSDEGLAAGWAVGTEPEFGDPEDPTLLSPAAYSHAYPIVPGQPPVHVKLTMGRPPRIEGKVFDAETGTPIEFADIEVVCLAPSWVDEYQDEFTDERGYYSMNLVDVPAHDLMVRVMDDEDRYAIIGPLDLLPGEVRVIDVGLSEPASLEGTVTDLANGTVIAGAEISVLPSHNEFEGADSWSMSDSEGEWTIDDIGTQPDNVWLLVQESDYGSVLMKVDDPSQPVEVRMGGQVTVKGKLTDAVTGEPVDNAEVLFIPKGPAGFRDDSEDMDFCDEDGTFSILLELCPIQGAHIIVESDEHMKYRAPLSELAPTDAGLLEYEIAIALTPLPRG